MLRLASLMRSAINRRRPMTLISVVSGAARPAALVTPAVGAIAALRSLRTMRPPGPEPATVLKSRPASRARRRLAGDAMTLPGRMPGAAAADFWDADCAGGGAAAAVAAAMAVPLAVAVAVAVVVAVTGESSLNSNTISGEPTATFSPGTPVTDKTLPLTGAGTSTAALSVITST